ncbi:redoxin domain-containing protein [Vibrio cholerae]|nr:redoxin domain-containing protein [Vibrio cholerae]
MCWREDHAEKAGVHEHHRVADRGVPTDSRRADGAGAGVGLRTGAGGPAPVRAPAGIARVGDRLPEVVLRDAGGLPVRLSKVLGAAAAIIVFYRGSWCPYCSIALKTYQRELSPAVEAFGTRLLAISPQAPDSSVAAARDAGIHFALYADEGNTLAAHLGIVTTPSPESLRARAALGVDVVGSNMDRTAAIPFPTVVVADATGTIRLIDVRVDYTSRTETCDIIDALIAL